MPRLHWSVVVVICAALAVVGVLSALKLVDASQVLYTVGMLFTWLSKSPLTVTSAPIVGVLESTSEKKSP